VKLRKGPPIHRSRTHADSLAPGEKLCPAAEAEPHSAPVPALYETDSVFRNHLIRVLTEEAIGLRYHKQPDKNLIAQVETFRDYLAGLDT
jgi:hypothetical protein